MAKTRFKTAIFEQVLEYIDGPEVVLLGRGNSKVIAIGVDRNEFVNPFLGAEISIKQWERYVLGLLDLRFLFTFPKKERWYLFELTHLSKAPIRLEPISKDEVEANDYLPDPGFFSYDHSEPIQPPFATDIATQYYQTDGVWDVPDFARLYKKLTDLYTFFLSLRKYKSDNTPLNIKKKIQQAFAYQPLRGGSSYVNLYDELWNVQELGDRLSIGKLSYASPGEVDIRGRYDVLVEIQMSMEQLRSSYYDLKHGYDDLYNYLAQNNLLRREAAEFDKDDSLARYIKGRADQLAELMYLHDQELIYRLTGNHSLLYAKVILSHFRRIERYYMFFAEGRLKTPTTKRGLQVAN